MDIYTGIFMTMTNYCDVRWT